MALLRWGLPLAAVGAYAALVAVGSGMRADPWAQARGSSEGATDRASRQGSLAAPRHGSTPLFEGPKERADRRRAQREAAVVRTLNDLPDVRAARVHLASPRRTTLDQPESEARAVAVLHTRGPPRDPAQLRAWTTSILRGAVPNLEAGAVEVVIVPGEAPVSRRPALQDVRVGPFQVSARSAAPLRALLAGLLVLNGVLAGALVWLWRRRA